MELRQLRYFVAVAEALHYGRAAEHLHVSQPNLSQQVKALEAELGVQLLDRNRRRVLLTPAGEAFADASRDVLARAERAAALAREVAAGERGRLRVSLTRSLTGGVAAELLDAFRARHPGVDLQVGVGYTALHLRQLRDGEVDAAFVRPPVDAADVELAVLADEPMVVALPAGHRLARRRRLRPRDLAGEPLVWWPREHGPGMWDRMLDAMYGPQAQPPIVRVEPEEERMISAVGEGAGITVITRGRSERLTHPGVRYRDFAEPQPTVPIALAWRKGDALPTLRALVAIASEPREGGGG